MDTIVLAVFVKNVVKVVEHVQMLRHALAVENHYIWLKDNVIRHVLKVIMELMVYARNVVAIV